jgi:hypothetical protein
MIAPPSVTETNEPRKPVCKKRDLSQESQTRQVAHLSCGLCAGVLVFVVAAPPLIGLCLGISGG